LNKKAMLRKLIFSCLLFTSFAFLAENFRLLKSIPSGSDLLTTDNLGNIYIVNNDLLEKYDGEGMLVKTYSNKSFGKITSVDASNSMKVLLFFKDFSRIVFLDNALSPIGDPVNLQDLGYTSVPLACTSNKGGIWIFNQQLPELVRFDGNLQKQESSGNIPSASGDILPQQLTEYNDHLFLCSGKKGIMIFDNYGTYNKTIPLFPLSDLQVREDNIVYVNHHQLMSYNMKTLAEDSLPLPDTSAVSHRTEKDKLFLRCRSSIRIYSVK
jgi:hypothetical protein